MQYTAFNKIKHPLINFQNFSTQKIEGTFLSLKVDIHENPIGNMIYSVERLNDFPLGREQGIAI